MNKEPKERKVKEGGRESTGRLKSFPRERRVREDGRESTERAKFKRGERRRKGINGLIEHFLKVM